MRIPKTLQAIADKATATAFVEPLRFDKIKRGWAIVDADSNELVEISPVYYSNGDRWKVLTEPKTSFTKMVCATTNHYEALKSIA